MSGDVGLQLRLHLEPGTTLWTPVPKEVCVAHHVSLQIPLHSIRFVAYEAGIGKLTGVCLHVRPQVAMTFAVLFTHHAKKWPTAWHVVVYGMQQNASQLIIILQTQRALILYHIVLQLDLFYSRDRVV